MSDMSRRDFLATTALAATAASLGVLGTPRTALSQEKQEKKGAEIRYGLVTYQWGKDWDLPTLLKNCEEAQVLGVELRTTHKHGVEPSLTDTERSMVRSRFEARMRSTSASVAPTEASAGKSVLVASGSKS